MMRPTDRHGRGCERARAWISLELDGELSHFELALLEAHLERCEPCAAASAETRALTDAIRAAPFERPAATVELPRREPARTARPVAVRLALAATLAALAAGLGVVAGSIDRGGGDAPPAVDSDIALLPSGGPDETRDLRGGLRPGTRPLDPIEPRGRGI